MPTHRHPSLNALILCLFLVLLCSNVLTAAMSGWMLLSTLISACLLLWPVLFSKDWRVFFLLNFPFASIAIVLAAYQLQYRGAVSPGLMQSLLAVNRIELIEKISQWSALLILLAALLTIYVFFSRLLRQQAIVHRKLYGVLFCWGLLLVIYQPYLSFELYNHFAINLDLRAIRAAYPANLVFSLGDALADLRSRTHATKTTPAVRRIAQTPRQLFITVVGESTRGQTFAEVARRTRFIEQHPGIVYFHDALAQANFTDASIPMLLSGAGTLADIAQRPYLIAWQNAASCLTVAISNSNAYDFLEDAAIRDIAGDSGVVHLSRYDHDMLPILDGILALHPRETLCVTMQMVGSHSDYVVRYRSEFALYPTPDHEPAKLTAEYNNSVVMVQDFLKQLIERADGWDGPAFLAFASDHGENLLEINELREHVTSTPTIYELAVPMLFYANEAFKAKFPQKWQQLGANANQPVSNESFAPTILDAMDIEAPAGFLEHSLFRPYLAQERYFTRPDFRKVSENELLKP